MRDSSIRLQISELLDAHADSIQLTPIETGLTHRAFRCQIAEKLYFVKYYNFTNNALAQVSHINQLTQFMRSRDIPAPHIVVYSSQSPQLVVHEYIDGSSATGSGNELAAIAQLYSRLVSLGLENLKQIPRSNYFQQLQIIEKRFLSISKDSLICQDLHQQYLSLFGRVIDILDKELLSDSLLHINIHDDFTEKNLLMKNDDVALLCDWDSYRLKYLPEHLSCTIMRFSTEAPLQGNIHKNKLEQLYRNLAPDVLQPLKAMKSYPSLFPVLATMKHLKTYGFRHSTVKHRRPDLEQSLLRWPLQHCQSLIENRHTITQWIGSFH